MFGSVVISSKAKAKAEISVVPFQSGSLTYTGAAQSPVWNGYDSNALEIGGTTSGTNAGTYTATFTPKEGYVWSDGTTGAKSVSWTIKRASLTVPSQKGSLSYTGSEQSPVWNNYDSGKMTISGTTKGTNAGTYTAKFTPGSNYQWSDGTTSAKSVSWSIGTAALSVPSQSGSLTYTGSALSPTWSNYDSSKMTIGGTTSGTNAGTYTATFTPKTGYQWSDGTTGTKSVTWSIVKAAGSLSLSKTSMSLGVSTLTDTISVTRAGDGAITASSSDTSVATVSVSGTTVTVTAKAKGSATITVNAAAGTNHTAPSSKTCAVTVAMPSMSLDDNTPEIIQAAARAGTAPNYWSVGDKIGIAINGFFGELTYNGTVYAFILGFNHNSAVEGNKSIHFQFGKTSDGTDIAFIKNYKSARSGFYMTNNGTSFGGWENSYIRKMICPAFLAAMPQAWQNVIVACTKYSDNVGGTEGEPDGAGGTTIIVDGNTASDVTSTSDKIWLLSEFEVTGSRREANSAEQNYQEQYEYYANGNSMIKYMHDETTKGCYWWTRSVYVGNYGCFVCVNGAGNYRVINDGAERSLGFAPGFMVA